ncbi:MAG: S-layer family protein [Nostoc sp.]
MSGMTRCWRCWLVLGKLLVMGEAIIAFSEKSALAQELKLIPDNTLGAESSIVIPNVDINGIKSDRIDGGAIRGANLFHSFQEFNIDEARGAYFTNPAGIENIFSRVTGGNASNILGKLGVLGNANLFLINPSGIIFGQNGSLDVRGSFVGTTANALGFGNQGFFNVDNPNTPPLLTVNPSAFLFNQIPPAPIQNNSIAPAGVGPSGDESFGLRVGDGRSLLLVGGDININRGELNAFGGRVELGGLARQGTVGLNFTDNNLSLSFPNNVEQADVSLTDSADANVRASNGGSITITARNINITDFGSLNGGLETNLGFPGAQAGDIELHAQGVITLVNGFINNTLERGAVGNGGDINITANSLFLTDGAQLNTSILTQYLLSDPLTQGNAGSVNISARDTVTFDGEISGLRSTTGAFSSVEDRAIGNAGEINIKTGSLLVNNGAVVDASNFGNGGTGTININARDTVSLDGENSSVKLETDDGNNSNLELATVGNKGEINITTRSLSLTNGAQVVANTSGKGDTANVTVVASDSVDVIGFLSSLDTQVFPTAAGNGGNISITTGRLTVRNGASVSSSTFGKGNAGNLAVTASDLVEVSKRAPVSDSTGSFYPGGLFTQVNSEGGGNGGNLSIKTARLIISDGAVVSARSFGTAGKANAGNIKVTASDFVEIVGINRRDPSALAASVGPVLTTDKVTGDAGDISVETPRLIIRDGGVLSSRNVGEGRAGNLEVMAGSILLDKGEIRTETALGNGGNITLSDVDLLQMRRNSKITASAGGNAQAGGNGGNITINAFDGFVVAVPDENSDITANAYTGSGGQVQIKATSIFGFTPRSREDLVRLLGTNDPAELNPQKLLTSDITAISQISPNLSGTITLNTPDVDPNRGLVNLPAVPLDTQVSQVCQPRTAQNQSSFIITGSGGLPLNPRTEPLSSDAVQVDWVSLKPMAENHVNTNSTQITSPIPAPIVEAQGWMRNVNGEMVLTAYVPTATPQSFWHKPADCRADF